MDICKLCDCHNGMVQFSSKHYYEKLKQGVTIVDCQFCGDTYEYEKDAHDKVTEKLIMET
jgi:redox-regulated HSP33 family molecular chaperone